MTLSQLIDKWRRDAAACVDKNPGGSFDFGRGSALLDCADELQRIVDIEGYRTRLRAARKERTLVRSDEGCDKCTWGDV